MPVEFIKVTPGKTAHVRILDATRLMGQHVDTGAVIEVTEEDARALIMAHKAKFFGARVEA
jgi:hypothetical protein